MVVRKGEEIVIIRAGEIRLRSRDDIVAKVAQEHYRQPVHVLVCEELHEVADTCRSSAASTSMA